MGHHKKKRKHKSKQHKRPSSESNSSPERSKKPKLIGPCLPPTIPMASVTPASTSNQDDSYGPQLPPHLTKSKPPELPVIQQDHDSEGEVIGPLPADVQNSSTAQQALDERAEILKLSFLLQNNEESTATQRETWMTELPPEKANFIGLGPRKFKKSAGTGDPKNRALWTETPLDKNKPEIPEQDTETFEELVVTQRNQIMDEIVEKNKEKQQTKSLLDIHRQELKKKKNDKEEQERRPFDRDVDLQVNRFDEAQKRSMLKKAQLLDSRFAHGKSKYL